MTGRRASTEDPSEVSATFARWREAVVAYVASNPLRTAKQVAAAVPHHYPSNRIAAQQVCRWAHKFGLLRDSGRPARFRSR